MPLNSHSSGGAHAAQLALDHPELVHTLDQHLNPAMGRGATPLHIAACVDRPGLVALLLERGADVNARGEDGATPLHHAAYCGSARAASG